MAEGCSQVRLEAPSENSAAAPPGVVDQLADHCLHFRRPPADVKDPAGTAATAQVRVPADRDIAAANEATHKRSGGGVDLCEQPIEVCLVVIDVQAEVACQVVEVLSDRSGCRILPVNAGGQVRERAWRESGTARMKGKSSRRRQLSKGRPPAHPRPQHLTSPADGSEDEHPVEGSRLVDVAAEGPPHLRDPVRGGVGPGQILLAGEHAPEQEGPCGSGSGVVNHNEM